MRPGRGKRKANYHLGGVADAGEFDPARFSQPVSGGVGIGYQFTDIWRADLTTDFFRSDFTGTARLDLPCAASAPIGTGCAYGTRADVRALWHHDKRLCRPCDRCRLHALCRCRRRDNKCQMGECEFPTGLRRRRARHARERPSPRKNSTEKTAGASPMH